MVCSAGFRNQSERALVQTPRLPFLRRVRACASECICAFVGVCVRLCVYLFISFCGCVYAWLCACVRARVCECVTACTRVCVCVRSNPVTVPWQPGSVQVWSGSAVSICTHVVLVLGGVLCVCLRLLTRMKHELSPWSACGTFHKRLYSSAAERQSCKLKVLASPPSGGF